MKWPTLRRGCPVSMTDRIYWGEVETSCKDVSTSLETCSYAPRAALKS
jgi:hypothetical protein